LPLFRVGEKSKLLNLKNKTYFNWILFFQLCLERWAKMALFLTENGEILVNEINTLPDFTNISMYPKLWEASGLTYTNLITRLIELVIEYHQNQIKLQHSAF